MTGSARPWRLFDGVGIEIEYAIVDADDLSVRPIADELLRDADGGVTEEVERETTCWSNELVRHVIELKTRGPSTDVEKAGRAFAADVHEINVRLAASGACLMPTAMHPLMTPKTDTHLWPFGQSEIYETYDRLFGCRGHGWANLQSVHLNLPFSGDAEFARLHAAIRVLLPLLPAVAASSPIVEGQPTGRADSRLWYYRGNQRAVPVVTGRVIPEPAFSRARYDEIILAPIAHALRPLDPDGILEAEWVNSRGAIARFSRGSIEIRLLDVQECPRMDTAIAAFVVSTLRALADERLASFQQQKEWSVDRLAPLLGEAETHGLEASFTPGYAALLGMRAQTTTAREIVEHLVSRFAPSWAASAIAPIVTEGCLAHRIERALSRTNATDGVRAIYRTLCDCLNENVPFSG